MLRPRKSQKARNSCSFIDITVHKDPQSPSNSLDESSDIKTLSKLKTRIAESRIRQSYAINLLQAAVSDVCQQQYCTQAYLLGLVQRRPLDEACPNVSAHCALGACSYHMLD